MDITHAKCQSREDSTCKPQPKLRFQVEPGISRKAYMPATNEITLHGERRVARSYSQRHPQPLTLLICIVPVSVECLCRNENVCPGHANWRMLSSGPMLPMSEFCYLLGVNCNRGIEKSICLRTDWAACVSCSSQIFAQKE